MELLIRQRLINIHHSSSFALTLRAILMEPKPIKPFINRVNEFLVFLHSFGVRCLLSQQILIVDLPQEFLPKLSVPFKVKLLANQLHLHI